MPTEKEVIVMTPVLWDDETTPLMWQLVGFNTLEEKVKEIRKTMELVGPIPRLVFNEAIFKEALRDSRSKCDNVAKELSDEDHYMALRGTYKPSMDKHHRVLIHRSSCFSILQSVVLEQNGAN